MLKEMPPSQLLWMDSSNGPVSADIYSVKWLICTQIFCLCSAFQPRLQPDCLFGVGSVFSLTASCNRIYLSYSYLLSICLDESSITSDRRSVSATKSKQLWTVTANHKKRLNIFLYLLSCAFRKDRSPQCQLSL